MSAVRTPAVAATACTATGCASESLTRRRTLVAMSIRTRLAATAVGVLSIAGIAIGALPASATTSPAINCIQNPSTTSNNAARFIGSNVNIRTGPSTACTAVGEGQTNHSVTAHCAEVVSGVLWVYLVDHTINRKGWSEARFLTWNGGLINC